MQHLEGLVAEWLTLSSYPLNDWWLTGASQCTIGTIYFNDQLESFISSHGVAYDLRSPLIIEWQCEKSRWYSWESL